MNDKPFAEMTRAELKAFERKRHYHAEQLIGKGLNPKDTPAGKPFRVKIVPESFKPDKGPRIKERIKGLRSLGRHEEAQALKHALRERQGIDR